MTAMTQQLGIVEKIEAFLKKYVTFSEDIYTLPIALWIIGTYLWPEMDAFPYMVITSTTKRAGKSRLAEMTSFVCSNPVSSGAMTPAAMYKTMAEEKPTLFLDEAETLSGESASTMRAVLNMGYRKGQVIRRLKGEEVREYQVYCPKVFILIGDVYDTLRDRSVIIRMKRAKPEEMKNRFVFDVAKAEGEKLRNEIDAMLEAEKYNLMDAYLNHGGIEFLTDRDEEIWTPLFAIASVLCKSRVAELSRNAVDMATIKTEAKERYVNLLGDEKKEQDDEYAHKLLRDLHTVINGEKAIPSMEAIAKLHELATSPWRRYRGDGLTAQNMGELLARFGVRPVPISIGNGRKDRKVFKGYKKVDVEKALKGIS